MKTCWSFLLISLLTGGCHSQQNLGMDGAVAGSWMLVCQDGKKGNYEMQSIFGRQGKLICLEDKAGQVDVGRKIRINPYKSGIVEIELQCDSQEMESFSRANNLKEVGLLVNGVVVGTSLLAAGKGSCAFGEVGSVKEALRICEGLAISMKENPLLCYDVCKHESDKVCVRQ